MKPAGLFHPGEFTGETHSWKIADAVLSEVRHYRAKAVPAHSHSAPYFSLLLDGSYEESSDDFSIVYQPYSFIYHAAQTPHSDAIGENGCRMFFIELLDGWTEALTASGPPLRHLFELDGSDPCWIALRLHREFMQRESGSATTVESLLYELCSYVTHSAGDDAREPRWLESVEARLRESFASPFSLSLIASEIGINPAHLCRSFRRFRGRTIGDFITNLRIQYVCRRLTASPDSLSDIALAGGFTDQSHMTRTFKRFTGYSPGAYRDGH